MRGTPETPVDVEGKSIRKRNAPIIFPLFALAAPTPAEEDYLKLADELKQNPPPNLTPESLSLVIQILTGEEPRS